MNTMAKQDQRQIELRPWKHCAIFLFACAVIVTRRPDAILNAQFCNEDGHVFFAEAYNFGWWTALFRSYEGYYHAFPRLGASLALLVPLIFAPLVLNLIAIGIQAVPANLLLSSRSSAWGSLPFRGLLAAIYLALPNTREMSNGISQSQWFLALCAFLLLAAAPPRSFAGRVFDLSILLLCGLTGPFCIFLFPIALFLVWKRPSHWRWMEASVVTACCFVQAWGLFSGGFSGRPHFALGASPALFARILAGQVFLSALIGGNGLAAYSSPQLLVFLICVAVGGIAIAITCFVRSTLEMRLFLFLSSMILVSSLISPTAYPPAGVSMWDLLAGAVGIRYWYFPTLAFAWSILWCIRSGKVLLKSVSAVLLCLMCFGIIRDWIHPAYQDMHFAEYAKHVEAAPQGTIVTIPENQPGWNLQLVKRLPQ
jgi:hypothetical protein